LLSQGIDPALVKRVRTCLMLNEAGRYAPSGLQTSASDPLTETSRLIDELEKAF
jgi:hypothetical protein